MFGPMTWGDAGSSARIIINPSSKSAGSVVLEDFTGNYVADGASTHPHVALVDGAAVSSVVQVGGQNTYLPGAGSARWNHQATPVRVPVMDMCHRDAAQSAQTAGRTVKFRWRPTASTVAEHITFCVNMAHGLTGDVYHEMGGGFWFRYDTYSQEFILSRLTGEVLKFAKPLSEMLNQWVEVSLYFSSVPYIETPHGPTDSDLLKTFNAAMAVNGIRVASSSGIPMYVGYNYNDGAGGSIPLKECMLYHPMYKDCRMFNSGVVNTYGPTIAAQNIQDKFFGFAVWDYITEAGNYAVDLYNWN